MTQISPGGLFAAHTLESFQQIRGPQVHIKKVSHSRMIANRLGLHAYIQGMSFHLSHESTHCSTTRFFQVKDSKKSEQAVELCQQGNILTVQYEDGKKNGMATLELKSDGSVFEFFYENDRLKNRAWRVFPDGRTIEYSFNEEFLVEGECEESFPNGWRFNFSILNGQKEGVASIQTPRGNSIYFSYRNGCTSNEAIICIGSKQVRISSENCDTARRESFFLDQLQKLNNIRDGAVDRMQAQLSQRPDDSHQQAAP